MAGRQGWAVLRPAVLVMMLASVLLTALAPMPQAAQSAGDGVMTAADHAHAGHAAHAGHDCCPDTGAEPGTGSQPATAGCEMAGCCPWLSGAPMTVGPLAPDERAPRRFENARLSAPALSLRHDRPPRSS